MTIIRNIFYVNTAPGAPAQHQGLIAALTDASANPLEWNTTGNTPVVTAAQYFTGLANTAVMAIPPTGIFPAAEAAVAYNAREKPLCNPISPPGCEQLGYKLHFSYSYQKLNSSWDKALQWN